MSARTITNLPLRALEGLLVVLAGGGCLCVLASRRRSSRGAGHPSQRKLLVFNSSYSLDTLRARGAEHLITHRDLDGYLEHVWTVHPLVGASPGEPTTAGPPTVTALSPRHTMVEGKVRRFHTLGRVPNLNFFLAQVSLVLTLDRIIRDHGVSMLRGDPYYNGLLALLLGRVNRCPVELRVIADHDAIYEATGRMAHPRLFRWRPVEQCVARVALSRADRVVIGTEEYRSSVLAYGAKNDRISCIGNWGMINPVHLHDPRERPQLESGLGDPPAIICVARLERDKHVEDVITSLAKVRRTHPNTTGVIVGDGSLRVELEQLRADLELDEHLVLAGDRNQPWLASMLAQASVVVAPLAGLALVEAALSGTPIVAYDYEWHSEVVRTGDTGILVPYRDTDALAAAICALLDDPERAEHLAQRARAQVLDIMEPARLLAEERDQVESLLAACAGR